MTLTDYYKFEHKPNTKSKTRLYCVASSKSYNPLEASTNSKGVIVIYIGDNTHTRRDKKQIRLINDHRQGQTPE